MQIVADLEEEAEFRFGVLEDMARESRFGASLAHLPHSKVDWSTSTEAMAAGGVCWIPEAVCGGFAPGFPITEDIVRDHFRSRVHKVILIPFYFLPRNKCFIAYFANSLGY